MNDIKENYEKFGPGKDEMEESIADVLIDVIERDRRKIINIDGKIYHLHPCEAKECLREEMNGNDSFYIRKYATEFINEQRTQRTIHGAVGTVESSKESGF
jgi:hypothetical protein